MKSIKNESKIEKGSLNRKDIEKNKLKSSSTIELLDSIIKEGIIKESSDIHIEPLDEYIRVRYRIDGSLEEVLLLDKKYLDSLVTRIKIISKLNIAERRLPQEGRGEYKYDNRLIDLRISIIPTIKGEKIAIRILDRNKMDFNIDSIGINIKVLKKIKNIINKNSGMLLVTGPTGSGKTTTLYTFLKYLNTKGVNIITIEDPVEYKLEGINQIEINNKKGLNYSESLKTILRMDPDIIMLGEIRTEETARMSIRSAITGHLVLTTLHTKNSISAIRRLIDMNIDLYFILDAVTGVLSQRLLKKLCNNCKTKRELTIQEKRKLNLKLKEKIYVFEANGCPKCINGYKGQIGIFEFFEINEEMRSKISKSNDINIIKNIAFKEQNTIYEEALLLLKKGLTSIYEVNKLNIID